MSWPGLRRVSQLLFPPISSKKLPLVWANDGTNAEVAGGGSWRSRAVGDGLTTGIV